MSIRIGFAASRLELAAQLGYVLKQLCHQRLNLFGRLFYRILTISFGGARSVDQQLLKCLYPQKIHDVMYIIQPLVERVP